MRLVFLFGFFVSMVPAVLYAASYNKPYVGDTIKYEAAFEDTFVALARDHNLGYVEIRAANPGVDPWIPGAGTDLILPTRHILPDAPREGIVINLPEMRLYAYTKKGEAPQSFPIGIGREGLDTPLGQTTVTWKRKDPTWRPTARMREEDPDLPEVVGPGPENPLGTHAIYLGWPTYAIHGTNKPLGIGRRISSGCIRLYPEDIKALYSNVSAGTMVTVVDQAVKAAWIDDGFYVEAHAPVEHSTEMEEEGWLRTQALQDDDLARILTAAGEDQDVIDWRLLRRVIQERRGYPVRVGVREGENVEAFEVVPTPKPGNGDEKVASQRHKSLSSTLNN